MNGVRVGPWSIRCGFCGAHAGDACRTRSGTSTKVHALRMADWQASLDPDAEGEKLADVIDLDGRRTLRQARANGYAG